MGTTLSAPARTAAVTPAEEDRLVEWALQRFSACRKRDFMGHLTMHFDHGVPRLCEVVEVHRPERDLPKAG
jgi:hypothetical protein